MIKLAYNSYCARHLVQEIDTSESHINVPEGTVVHFLAPLFCLLWHAIVAPRSGCAEKLDLN